MATGEVLRQSLALLSIVLSVMHCKAKTTGSSTDAGDPAGNGGTDTTLARDSDTSHAEDSEQEVIISSVPDSWSRPADCDGVGDACDFLSCDGDAICQTVGDVCVPEMTEERPFSETYPYCMSYVCMTYEEASCYCTGAGADVTSDCVYGPAAVVGLCAKISRSCADTSCCGDLDCVEKRPGESLCEILCENNDDCGTGCCADKWGHGTKVCAPMSLCDAPCTAEGEHCEEASECCSRTCFPGDTGMSGCRSACAVDADCYSGCCYHSDNWDSGYCMPPEYCSCLEEGALNCDTAVSPCCENLTCATVSASAENPVYRCHPICRVDSDCTPGCCSAYFEGEDYGICIPESDC